MTSLLLLRKGIDWLQSKYHWNRCWHNYIQKRYKENKRIIGKGRFPCEPKHLLLSLCLRIKELRYCKCKEITGPFLYSFKWKINKKINKFKKPGLALMWWYNMCNAQERLPATSKQAYSLLLWISKIFFFSFFFDLSLLFFMSFLNFAEPKLLPSL